MTNLTEKAKQWPRAETGEVIFKTTNDAIFYANLIAKNKRLVDDIDLYRRLARGMLKVARQEADPNYDVLMHMAVKAQFFRECLDEVKRIRDEP